MIVGSHLKSVVPRTGSLFVGRPCLVFSITFQQEDDVVSLLFNPTSSDESGIDMARRKLDLPLLFSPMRVNDELKKLKKELEGNT